jgi:hypothetical protein
MIIIIAALGLVWVIICLGFYKRDVSRAFRISFSEGIKSVYKSRWGKDFWGSIAFMAIGFIVLLGVTGMAIGLLASFIFSIYNWVSGIFSNSNKPVKSRF